ncbi:hypothetical protein NliqN6_2465 [Naganishia liquefaciens]|uniref:Dol-P-Man:Man(5)GlcNAc(2)-PP-Dol alpha-1,3-mannosyltransferase n=1 Tax=Naganishia liquefaciens TaxID=104408 RepID=A0A8H3YEA5_9TREE|nr:hypothetical protein NliqN6_2465 [Naganishia liquefaciens]
MSPTKATNPNRQSVISTAILLVLRLLTDTRYYWHLFSLIFLGEIALCALVIRYVAYTNIDYLAYTQQAALFLPPSNIRDYSQIQGGTGPLVYPALHLYIYSALHQLFPAASTYDVAGFVPDDKSDLEDARIAGGKTSLRQLQAIWAGVYLSTLLLVAFIYRGVISSIESRRPAAEKKEQAASRTATYGPDVRQSLVNLLLGSSPPLQPFLLLLPLSKRLHSIYMLRLFNDPLAMIVFYFAVLLLCKKQWHTGVAFYALALGIKMNILLFLPGLLVLLFQYKGAIGTIVSVGMIAIIQLLLPAPYFFSSRQSAQTYFASAFDFGREFLFKWSVNWRWLGEDTFLSKELKRGLLISHFVALILFAYFRWSSIIPGGTVTVLKRGLSSVQALGKAPISRGLESGLHIPFVLFTSNMLGILFARSLHYQFFSWYAHQLPFLLWLTRWPLIVCATLWVIVLWVWDSFPPSTPASFILFAIHAAVAFAIFWKGEIRSR